MKMSKLLSAVAGGVLVAGSATVLAATPAAAASSCSGPDGQNLRYKISDWTAHYTPTNLMSDWVYPKYGTASVSYSKTHTATTTASTTATVTAEAGVIFAKASTAIGVTVGKSWAKSSTWTYTLNAPKDRTHKYRLHMYHYSYDFTVTKYAWECRGGHAGYVRSPGFPQRVHHAPVGKDRNVWRLDKARA